MYLKLLFFVTALHSMKELASSQSYDIPTQRRSPQPEASRIHWIGRGENHDLTKQRHDDRRFAYQRQGVQEQFRRMDPFEPYQQRQLLHPSFLPSFPPNHPALNFPINQPALNVPSYLPPSLNYPPHLPESVWPVYRPGFVRPESEILPAQRSVRPVYENFPDHQSGSLRPKSEKWPVRCS